MNDLINKYNRISAILSSLNIDYRKENSFDEENLSKSVATLSEELGIPKDQLRQDLMFLMASPVFRTCIDSGDTDADDDSGCLFSDELLDLFDRQSEGWDTLPINFHFNEIFTGARLMQNYFLTENMDSAENVLLPVYMSETERELFYRCVPTYKKENWNTLLFKYPPSAQTGRNPAGAHGDAGKTAARNQQLSANREEVTNAIRFERSVNFRYRDKTGAIEDITIRPLRILESLDSGLHYIISSPDSKNITFHRLDRIQSNVRITKKAGTGGGAPESPDEAPDSPLRKFDYIWDADAAYDQEPFDVRIRIEAGTRNILQKIKSETSRRRYARLTQSETDPDVWYYTDKVIGFHSFRRWVYQYGASMTVLEPRELADSICQSALSRLEFYDKGKFERET